MNRVTKLLGALLAVAMATPASAIQFTLRGDLNNRFMLYTDQGNLYSGAETIGSIAAPGQRVTEDATKETWGEVKYRLQAEAGTDDKLVKGVYAIELGAVRFGRAVRAATVTAPAQDAGASIGGGFSGDGVNVETRFAYVDFGVTPKHKVTVGLMPFLVNKYLWSETAMGVQLKGDVAPVGYTLAWVRGFERFNTASRQTAFRDDDNLLLRGDFTPMKGTKIGLFGLYQHASPDVLPSAAVPATPTTQGTAAVGGARQHLLKLFNSNTNAVKYDIWNVGLDGTLTMGAAFLNFDAIYQGGTSETTAVSLAPAGEADHRAFFGHIDLGYNLSKAIKVTYTGWYATGDRGGPDSDINNFIATDVDTFDSIIFFEGGYVDDNYLTEAPYFLNFGAIFNKLAIDFKPTDKLTLNGAVMYVQTQQQLPIGGGRSSRNLGTEIDGAIAYKLNPNMELAVNAGYLIAGDGMDFFEANTAGATPIRGNGESDANVFRAMARARYTF